MTVIPIRRTRQLWLLVGASIAFGCCSLVQAQDYTPKNHPVLSPTAHVNGVDLTSGGYIAASPFRLSAPGAGNLNSQFVFNGRRLSFAQNIYLDDETFTPYGVGDPAERHVRIHVGGADKLFTCYDVGVCQQNVRIDGSILNRIAFDKYVLTDKNGAVYTFFDLAFNYLLPCTENEPDCNNAGYHAYAYVSTIQYPNGERLTYEPFSDVSGGPGNWTIADTINSNLGYRLVLQFTFANYNPPSVAGLNWLMHRVGRPYSVLAQMSAGSTLLGSVQHSMAYANQFTDATVTQVDSLGRVFTMQLHADSLSACIGAGQGGTDSTLLTPRVITSPGGVTTTVAYFPFLNAVNYNQPVQTVTRSGQTWIYAGTGSGMSATSPLGGSISVSAAGMNSPYYIPVGCGNSVGDWNIYSVSNELGLQSSYEYGGPGVYVGPLITGATLPEGNGYKYDFDARGNLTQITQAAKGGSGLPDRVVHVAHYDATCSYPVKCNKPNWTRDAKGNQTDFTYDLSHGGALTITKPAQPSGVRPQVRFTYTPYATSNGTIYRESQRSQCMVGASCAGTADEQITSTTYWNATFLPQSVTTTTGNGVLSSTTSFSYDAAGNVTQVTDALGNSTFHHYDAAGRQIGTISADPDGAGSLPRLASRTTYNADDQVTRVDEGVVVGTSLVDLNSMTVNRFTDVTYNASGLKTSESTVSGGQTQAVTQFSYDEVDRLQCSAVRMNAAAFSSLPASACQLGAEGSLGPDRITRYVYDLAGQLLVEQRAYGTNLQQDYATYTYSNNAKRSSLRDAKGNLSSLSYDGFDRLTRMYLPDASIAGQASATDYEEYGYDANDNRTLLRKRDGRVFSWTYDLLDRAVSKIVPDSCVAGYACTNVPANATRDVHYGYNNFGLQTYARFDSASGEGISNGYDGLGRLVSTTKSIGGQSQTLSYLHDAAGNRTRLTFPDGEAFTYGHDSLNRLGWVYEGIGPSTFMARYDFDSLGRLGNLSFRYGDYASRSYDAAGRLQQLQHGFNSSSQSLTYAYNPARQIVSRISSNEAYAYTGSSPTSYGFTVNGLNQYLSAGSSNYAYDSNGNLTSDGSSTLTYDAENRLTAATGGAVVSMSYDPLGRLHSTSGGAAGETRFLYDGNELVAEYNSSGSLLRRYVHGAAVDDPLLWYEGAGLSNPRFLHSDHQGTVIAASLGNTGNAGFVNTYDEWGKLATSNQGRFQYTGQILIPELGAYYYKARIYSPNLGRFLQTDPIGYADDNNLYGYVGNDPANARDPSGRQTSGCSAKASNDHAPCGDNALGLAPRHSRSEFRPVSPYFQPESRSPRPATDRELMERQKIRPYIAQQQEQQQSGATTARFLWNAKRIASIFKRSTGGDSMLESLAAKHFPGNQGVQDGVQNLQLALEFKLADQSFKWASRLVGSFGATTTAAYSGGAWFAGPALAGVGGYALGHAFYEATDAAGFNIGSRIYDRFGPDYVD